MLIYIFYKLLLFLGDPILLGGFKLGYEVLDLFGVDVKDSACRADRDFILDDGYE